MVLGGLVSTVLLTLFVLPVLAARFGAVDRSAMGTELDLLHRWAGVTPAPGSTPERHPVGERE